MAVAVHALSVAWLRMLVYLLVADGGNLTEL